MPRIKVSRFIQDPAHCAVAASACVANKWNSNIDYEMAKQIAYKKVSKKIENEGMYTTEIGSLLNELGFKKVTIVSSCFYYLDYKWEKYSKKKLISTLKNAYNQKKCKEEKKQTKMLYKWLEREEYDNNVVIDFNFGDYIRKSIDKKNPLVLSFNWTMFFRFPKGSVTASSDSDIDPVNGESEEHGVCCCGYDKKGVYICDSHHQYYKYTRAKYRKGFYKMTWENLMTCMGQGDLIIPEDYDGSLL